MPKRKRTNQSKRSVQAKTAWVDSALSSRMSSKSKPTKSKSSKSKSPKNKSSKNQSSKKNSLSTNVSFYTAPLMSPPKKIVPRSTDLQKTKRNLETKRKARQTIRSRINKVKTQLIPRVRARYLNAICSKSGVCLAFGHARKKIRTHFDDFTNFTYVKGKCNRIGKVSNNGFVIEVPYEREGYAAHAVLKSSVKPSSDNLVYEYYVGNYLNELGNYYPCLVETYGLFEYRGASQWRTAKNTKTFSNLWQFIAKVEPQFKTVEDFSAVIDYSCVNPVQFCVLIQHFKDVISAQDLLEKINKQYNRTTADSYHMIKTLFQVYYFLHQNKFEFTHYDLHTNNVLLYEPVPGKVVEYVYEIEDNKKIRFYCKYIPKIIDYGRSFYDDYSDYFATMCNQPSCEPHCGFDRGYGWFENDLPANVEHNITSAYPNVSHDLRLYNYVRKWCKSSVIQNMKGCVYKTEYGTPPIPANNSFPDKVANVTDAYYECARVLSEMAEDVQYSKEDVLATIHVYGKNKKMDVNYYA